MGHNIASLQPMGRLIKNEICNPILEKIQIYIINL